MVEKKAKIWFMSKDNILLRNIMIVGFDGDDYAKWERVLIQPSKMCRGSDVMDDVIVRMIQEFVLFVSLLSARLHQFTTSL